MSSLLPLIEEVDNDIFLKELGGDHENVLACDALALSCARYRLVEQEGKTDVYSFIDGRILINDDDIVQAKLIREYYGKKFLWASLKQQELSEFRKRLLEYLHSKTPHIIKNDQIGMIYCMPYFFKEDKILDQLKSQANIEQFPAQTIFKDTNQIKELKPMAITQRRSKNQNQDNFWFLDSDNRLCEVTVPRPNVLEHIWLNLFNTSNSLTIEGFYRERNRADFAHYQILNWNLK